MAFTKAFDQLNPGWACQQRPGHELKTDERQATNPQRGIGQD